MFMKGQLILNFFYFVLRKMVEVHHGVKDVNVQCGKINQDMSNIRK